MDLIRLLCSLEEFLHELIGWFVFYPRTFCVVSAHERRGAPYAGSMIRIRKLRILMRHAAQKHDVTQPNEDNLKRYGKIVAGIMGAVASTGIDVIVLISGAVPV